MESEDPITPWFDEGPNGERECHAPDGITVFIGGSGAVIVDKLYGPLAASEVRVRLDDLFFWVVEYMNPTTKSWEVKARWWCQENWPSKPDGD